jgi:hypothetical protein
MCHGWQCGGVGLWARCGTLGAVWDSGRGVGLRARREAVSGLGGIGSFAGTALPRRAHRAAPGARLAGLGPDGE